MGESGTEAKRECAKREHVKRERTPKREACRGSLGTPAHVTDFAIGRGMNDSAFGLAMALFTLSVA